MVKLASIARIAHSTQCERLSREEWSAPGAASRGASNCAAEFLRDPFPATVLAAYELEIGRCGEWMLVMLNGSFLRTILRCENVILPLWSFPGPPRWTGRVMVETEGIGEEGRSESTTSAMDVAQKVRPDACSLQPARSISLWEETS